LEKQIVYNRGFDILKTAYASKFTVIFITAYDEYAIKAIKHNAFDYVLKPLDRDELINVVNKYLSKESSSNSDQTNTKPEILKNQLSLPTTRGFRIVEIDKVVRLESDGNYTKIFLEGGEEVLVSKAIKEYENILPKELFCRVHNSHIINIAFLVEYVKGRGGEVVLKDGSVISVSQNRKADFLNMYK